MTETTDTTTTTTTDTTTAAPNWYDGFDADTKGYIANRGLGALKPEDAFLKTFQAHREAERHFGVPADQLVRLPKDASDEATAKALWAKLGVPAEAAGYDLSQIKLANGEAPDAGFLDFIRTTAHKYNVPAAAAQGLASDLAKYVDGVDAQDNADTTAKAAAEKQALNANWGPNVEANTFIAKQAAAKLGIAPEAVGALEGQVGYKAVMEMFLKIGQTIGEDKFVTNQNPNAPGVYTKDAAQSRLNELMADRAWADRLGNGDAQATREFRALTEIIAGVSGQYKAA